MKNWEQGALYEVKPRSRKRRKIDDEELIAYVKEHPDHYLAEISSVFNVSTSGIYAALQRLRVSTKKNTMLSRKR